MSRAPTSSHPAAARRRPSPSYGARRNTQRCPSRCAPRRRDGPSYTTCPRPRADGSFEARIDASGPERSGDGAYRITVGQGFDSAPPDLVLAEVVDGAAVPEFGALAAAALAAAVVVAASA